MADAQEDTHGSKRLRTAEHELNDDDESIWVCSAEGQKIRWSRAAAECAGSLKDWIEDTGGEGAFGSGEMMAHNPPATFLKTLRDACAHDGDELGDHLHSFQFHETVGLLHAAHFLAATGVFATAARHLCCTLLAGKSVDELRLILGATNDLSSSEQASALSELAFTLPTSGEEDDAMASTLEAADALLICRLKAVSNEWRSRARNELCRRASCCGAGRAAPAILDEIVELDLDVLHAIGRSGRAVIARARDV